MEIWPIVEWSIIQAMAWMVWSTLLFIIPSCKSLSRPPSVPSPDSIFKLPKKLGCFLANQIFCVFNKVHHVLGWRRSKSCYLRRQRERGHQRADGVHLCQGHQARWPGIPLRTSERWNTVSICIPDTQIPDSSEYRTLLVSSNQIVKSSDFADHLKTRHFGP